LTKNIFQTTKAAAPNLSLAAITNHSGQIFP
jgi:hypothetical protein